MKLTDAQIEIYRDKYLSYGYVAKRSDFGFKVGDIVYYNSPGTGGVKQARIESIEPLKSGNPVMWWKGVSLQSGKRASSPCYISFILKQIIEL